MSRYVYIKICMWIVIEVLIEVVKFLSVSREEIKNRKSLDILGKLKFFCLL